MSPVLPVRVMFPPLPAVELELRLPALILFALSVIGPPFPVVELVSIAPVELVVIVPLVLVKTIALPGFVVSPAVISPVVVIAIALGLVTLRELAIFREPKGTVPPRAPLILITPVPVVKTRLPPPSTVPPKLISPAFVNPVSRVTLEPVARETWPPKIIFCSLVIILALFKKLVVGALKVIEALFVPVMFPLTAIVAASIVTGKLKVTPAGSIAIAPVPFVRPIIIWENPFKNGGASSAALRFKRASAVLPPTVISKLGVSGCNWIVPIPLT